MTSNQALSATRGSRDTDEPVLRAIRGLAATQLACRAKLAARLEELASAYEEDYAGGSLSVGAIGALVEFLRQTPSLKEPSVTATPSGDVYAEWVGPQDLLLGVRFLSSGEVHYVIFSPNPVHEGRADRASGTTTADALMKKLSFLDARGWLTEREAMSSRTAIT
jgi:hypothetical protein